MSVRELPPRLSMSSRVRMQSRAGTCPPRFGLPSTLMHLPSTSRLRLMAMASEGSPPVSESAPARSTRYSFARVLFCAWTRANFST